jgi:predicted RNA-binding protein YlxR (DUF448 family)
MSAPAHEAELDNGPRQVLPGANRLCAATGTVRPVAEMIRFVVGPDGAAVPDLKRRLPGRGIWVTATRQALQTAVGRNAFARGFKREVRVAPDLVDTTDWTLVRHALDALGIANKAGRVAIGFTKVELAIRGDDIVGVVHASGAAPVGMRKIVAALRRRLGNDVGSVPLVGLFPVAQLDLALGRPNVIHAALLAGPESESFLARARRLERFRTNAIGTEKAA